MTADYKTNQVSVRHLGGNPSNINGKIIKNETEVMKHGDVLEFLVGQYPFKVEFTHLPDTKINGAAKRSLELVISDKSDMPKLKKDRKMESKETSLDSPQTSKTVLSSVNDKKTEDELSTEIVKDVSSVMEKICDERKQVKEQLGPPQEKAQWSQNGSVLVYMAAGVRSSSKVCTILTAEFYIQ